MLDKRTGEASASPLPPTSAAPSMPVEDPRKGTDGKSDLLIARPVSTNSFVDARAGEAPREGTAEQARQRPAIQPKDATVLVVEDNVSNFVLIARMLAYMGVPRCEWKTSGWQVVEYADILPRVDLILMDLRLPYEDGYTALRKVRASPRLKDTIVVAVTAEANDAQMTKARQAGFDGFLGKPLDPDHFPDQIRRLLRGDPVWEL